MWATYLGFVLLVWFPEGLHAQNVTQSCSAPTLDGGLIDPRQEIYSPGTQLTYTCNDGFKPAAQGWWGISTCEHGTWSPVPQCIDESACVRPNIPNGKYTEAQNVWYDEGTTISVMCDEGFEPTNQDVAATCVNGTWSSVPNCERFSPSSGSSEREVSIVPIRSCGKKPSMENGDIVKTHQTFLKYQCNSYYTLVGPEVVVCYSNGTWSERPTCRGLFCAVNTEEYSALKNNGIKYLRNGETVKLECEKLKLYWMTTHYAKVQCTDGETQIGKCCGWIERNTDLCD